MRNGAFSIGNGDNEVIQRNSRIFGQEFFAAIGADRTGAGDIFFAVRADLRRQRFYPAKATGT
jgi:hypothetical protein